MPKIRKTRSELEQELVEQIEALRDSARAYDEGKRWEAKRLATTTYTLLHDSQGGRSKSLLGMLGLRTGMRFLSSISQPVTQPEFIGWKSAHGLVHAETKYPEAYYVPKLAPNGEIYRSLKFEQWWEEVVFRGLSDETVSRKNLTHYLRSQDGGSHVDDHLGDETYAYWKHSGDPSLRYETQHDPPSVSVFGPAIEISTGKMILDIPNEGMPLRHAPNAAMRQISWELDQAIIQIGY